MQNMQEMSGQGQAVGRADELERLRQSLSAIYHDINNPISIVVGNAELLLEMAQSSGLGPEFVDPLVDIGKAAQDISAQVERMIELKNLGLD